MRALIASILVERMARLVDGKVNSSAFRPPHDPSKTLNCSNNFRLAGVAADRLV